MDEYKFEGLVVLGSLVVLAYCIARIALGLLGIW